MVYLHAKEEGPTEERQPDEVLRWKTEKDRIYKELGLPPKACLGEILTCISGLRQQLAEARAERDEAMHHLAIEMAKNNSPESQR